MLKPLVILALLGAHAGATVWTPNWYRKCEGLLKNLSRYRSPAGTTADELRLKYNELALSQVSKGALKTDTQMGPELTEVLDRALPHWREDGDWVLQPANLIRLYTRKSSDPKLFRAYSLILMNGSFASGEIVFFPDASIDLFE